MSGDRGIRGVHISAGEGIVAHLPNLTAFAKGDEARLNELLVRLNALADAPWNEVVRTLTAGITEANYEQHPDLACVSIGDDRVYALVYGDTSLSVRTDGTETSLDGRDSSTWIDVAIHGKVDRVLAGRQSPSVIVGVLRDGVVPAGGFLLDTAGPMPSSTRWVEIAEQIDDADPEPTLAPIVAATSPAHEPLPAPEPVIEPTPEPVPEPIVATPPPVPSGASSSETTPPEQSQDQNLSGLFARLDQQHREEATDLETSEPIQAPETTNGTTESAFPMLRQASQNPASASTPEPEPGPAAAPATPAAEMTSTRPQLRGILCHEGHLTSANDFNCRTCGIATDPEAEIVMGDRPVLGLLTFDDGAVLELDRPAAVGSGVPTGYEIDGELATIVRLDDGVDGISAVQIEVRTIGWEVEIHDMNSENGTYTILHGERQTRTRLRAGQSVVLQQGMTVELGGRHFDFTVGARQPEDAV